MGMRSCARNAGPSISPFFSSPAFRGLVLRPRLLATRAPGAHTDSAGRGLTLPWALYTVTVFTGCSGCRVGAVGGGKDLTNLAKKAAWSLVQAGVK